MTDYSGKNKQIVKNTLFLYVRSFFLLLLSLYTSRLVLQVLGVEDYGIYNIVGGVVALFSILGSSMTSASQRFITYALGKGDIENLKKVFSTCVTLHIVLGIILLLLLEVVGVWFVNNRMNIPFDRISVANVVFQLSVLTFFVNILAVPYNSLIISHEKLDVFAYVSLFEGLLKFIAILILKFFLLDKLFYYAIGQFSIAIIIRFIYTIYSSVRFEEAKNIKYSIEKKIFKEMFIFSGWNLIGSGALVLRNQGIDVLLNLFFGVTVNAAKGIANQVQGAIHMLVSNFTTSITPQLTKSIAQNDELRTNSLIFHGGRLSFFLMMLFAVPILVCTDEVLGVWLIKVPDYTAGMVRLIIIYLLSDSLSRFLINGLLANGNIRDFQLIIGGIKLMALPITYIVLLFGGDPFSGLLVNILLDIVCLFGRLYFTQKRINLSSIAYIKKVVFPCWISLFVAFVPSFLLCKTFSNNIMLAIVVCLFFTIVTIMLFAEKNERAFLTKTLIKILKKSN